MRRLGAILIAGALLWPGVSQAEPGAYGAVEQLAEADWMDLKAKRFYFAMGTRGVGPDGLQTMGFVGQGSCQVHKSKHFTMVACSGSARGRELSMEEFQVDPTMASASMSFTQGRHTHSVEWTGEEVPAAGTQTASGGYGIEAGAGAARYAPASGELFGRKLKAGGRNGFGILSQSGWAVVYQEGRSVTLLDDGSVRVRVEYRIPR